MIKTIAVIGAGRMGGGIAKNLARDGSFSVSVFDASPVAVQACVAAGAREAKSVADAVADADLVITSLPTPEIVTAVCHEAVTAGPKDAIWMDVSTIDPGTAAQLEGFIEAAGRHFVACPLGKGPAQAEAGTLPLFVGGRQELLEALGPVFDCVGDGVHYLGSVEAATSFKIVSNMIGMTNLAVLAEGTALCRACGVPDDAFADALQDTGGWSYQAQLRLPWMVAGDFDNRFGVDLAIKDVRLAVDVASRRGVPVPLGGAALMQLVSAHSRQWGGQDVDAIYKLVDPGTAV